MSRATRLQTALYRVFLVTCTTATVLGLTALWGLTPGGEFSNLMYRSLVSCVIVAIASALTMSATRLVTGRSPEDDRG